MQWPRGRIARYGLAGSLQVVVQTMTQGRQSPPDPRAVNLAVPAYWTTRSTPSPSARPTCERRSLCVLFGLLARRLRRGLREQEPKRMSELPRELHHAVLAIVGTGTEVHVLANVGMGFVVCGSGIVEAE